MIKFIDNQGDYFASNYFDEDFIRKVFDKTGYSSEDIKIFNNKISQLKDKYFKFKNEYLSLKRSKDRIKITNAFHTEILNALGYDGNTNDYSNLFLLNNKEGIPVRKKLYRGNKPHLFIMEMQSVINESDTTTLGLFEQVYKREQWEYVFQITDPDIHLSPSVINEAISELFLIDQEYRPHYVLMLAGSEIYLIQFEKWFRGSYLRFSLEDLFNDAIINRNYYSLFYFLTSKETLAPDSDIILIDQLDEESHKSAYAVTKDLKEGIIKAVELLANESVYYLNSINKLESLDENFAENLKNDCITLIYRLLFVLYAESRSELEILPMNDRIYDKGYSLEMLRDLEQVPLTSESSKNGYFFHDSLSKLFILLNNGFNEKSEQTKSFIVNHIDTPLFDNHKFEILKEVKFRNYIWQDIISQLSLSQKQRGKARGRISYANLGINQLGSVYEGLLSYKGFFADQDYIEVKKADDANGKEGTYVVPRSRRGDFEEDEILKDSDNPERDKVIPKGTFIYRLSGRDRQKSASYYTPEVLTQTVVKYTLKPILEKLEKKEIMADSLLELKILEPAMGAAAFQNEVINQVAEAYLNWKQKEIKQRVPPANYREELQKVKSYIATNNVYGVDINPTAIELGKLSIWLNVIHKDMETPYFGYRLGVGNAVVGAWRKVFHKSDIIIEYEKNSRRIASKEWWEKAPRQVTFSGKRKRKADEIYHFLIPDKNMVPSAGIKMLKDEFTKEAKYMQKWRKEFCKPINDNEYELLQTICEKIDELFEEHYQHQKKIIEYTKDKSPIWPQKSKQLELISYYAKESFAKQRNDLNAPYYKLKTIMDYWCSLWFWDMRDAAELPTREQYWDDILNIMDINIEDVSSKEIEEEIDVFAPKIEQLDLGIVVPMQSRLKGYKSKEQKDKVSELISKYITPRSLFPEKRKLLIQKYTNLYKFFHYELEFIEVFKERGGFDITVGNPPWIKLEFNEKGLLSEKKPEFLIRNFTVPQIREELVSFFEDLSFKELYYFEKIELESQSTFLNSKQNYPLLIGQQTDLYKCILENTINTIGQKGYIGLIHPDSIYDDANGKPLRKEIYKRLKYHFQFINELKLFNEVDHHKLYGIHIYSGTKGDIGFATIHNLFHPNTISNSFIHSGLGPVSGIKVKDESQNKYIWNTHPHKDRIIYFNKDKMKLLAKSFEDSEEWENAKLISIHCSSILNIIEKFSKIDNKLTEDDVIIKECWHETYDVDDGIIEDISLHTKYPEIMNYELIYNGPHIHVNNPLYKSPRNSYTQNSNYDSIELLEINEQFLPKTRFIPAEDIKIFNKRISGFDENRDWIEKYKFAVRKMVGQASERTLQSAIIPPKVSHTGGIISAVFKNLINLVVYQSVCSSLLLDFYVKSKGIINFSKNALLSFPILKDKIFTSRLIVRTLLLNCLNKYYAEMWNELYDEDWKNDLWSIEDSRLKRFESLNKEWSWDIPIRNSYGRRIANIEIDVIVAMAFKITLDELLSIYNIQFPVLQQYEDETYYDSNGRIIYTSSSGMSDVGIKKQEFELIRDMKEGVYEQFINNDLYQNKKIINVAPFNKCDRVEDYKRAWSHFEKIFSEENK